MKPTLKNKPTSKKVEYEQLGRILASVYESGYIDRAKSYRMSFIKGMLQGFGGVIGATVGIALLLWVLSFFGELPLIGNFINTVRTTIEQP